MFPQFPNRQFDCIAVVEIRVRLLGVQVSFCFLRLFKGLGAGLAVSVPGNAAAHGQPILQKLDVQVAVLFPFRRLVPHPDQRPLAGGVQLPVRRIRFQQDLCGGQELFPGEVGGRLSEGFHLSRAFRRVDRQIAAFQHAAGELILRHGKVSGVSVHKGTHRCFHQPRAGLFPRLVADGVVRLVRQRRKVEQAKQ